MSDSSNFIVTGGTSYDVMSEADYNEIIAGNATTLPNQLPATLDNSGITNFGNEDTNFNVPEVAIYRDDFTEVLQDALALRARRREPSIMADQPLEKGQITSDYSVDYPIEIIIEAILSGDDYRDTYQQVKALKVSKELLSVKTRVGYFENMVIQDIPSEESPDAADVLPMQIIFREVYIVAPENDYVPADETQTDTIDRGEQQGIGAVDPVIQPVVTVNGSSLPASTTSPIGTPLNLQPVPIGSNSGASSASSSTPVISGTPNSYNLQNQGTAIITGLQTVTPNQSMNVTQGFSAARGY